MVHRYRQPVEALLDACRQTGTRLLVWISEQGPERDIEVARAQNFHNVIVNNDPDYDFYRASGVENVYRMPFGCTPAFHRRVPAPPKYKTDLVCYGNPLYTFYPDKRAAVDTLVGPVVEAGLDVALWGIATGSGGWLEIPYVKERPHVYRGVFPYEDLPAVNSGAKIVLGITANGRYGAYGSRLARALGCGSFVIWHYSAGMEQYFENHKHLCWSTSPGETLDLVNHYLAHDAERERIAREGQRYAYEHLDYARMLPPIIDDVLAQPEIRNSSAWFDRVRPLKERYEAGDYAAVERTLRNGDAPRPLPDELVFYLANSLYFLGRYDESAALFRGLLERKAQPEWLNNYGVVMNALGHGAEAEQKFRQSIEYRPDYLDARYNLQFRRLNAPAPVQLIMTKRYFRA
jgi:hypothetical protein